MISQEEGEGEEGLWTPARPNRWPGLFSSVYARILSSFCSISAPSSNDPFFFFSSSFPKNREIPFNSLLENELSLPPSWGIVAPLAQFFLVKGPFDFSFLPSEIFFFILFGGERREDIRERREVFILFVVMR